MYLLRVELCRLLKLFESLGEEIAQPRLQGHLGGTSAGSFKPVVEIPYLHTMLDFGLFDAHQDAGGKSEIVPFRRKNNREREPLLAKVARGIACLLAQPRLQRNRQ